jgi:hypothetical protein
MGYNILSFMIKFHNVRPSLIINGGGNVKIVILYKVELTPPNYHRNF